MAHGLGHPPHHQTRPNYPRYGYFANFKYILQRLSAIGFSRFLGAHLWLAFIKPRFIEGAAESFADISHEMHFHRPTLVVYILGVLAIAYHLGNGVHQALMTWGVESARTPFVAGSFSRGRCSWRCW